MKNGAIPYAAFSNYNAAGQPGPIGYRNGASTVLEYKLLTNQLQTLTTTAPWSGTVQDFNYSDYDLNGNIKNITDGIDPDRTQGFDYDGLNRLTEANSYSYGTLNPLNPTYDGTGNISTYDTGNTANRSLQNVTYDCDNRVTAVDGTSFVYNFEGLRVKKSSPGSETIYIDNLYEVTNGIATKHIFAGARRIASKTASETYYYHLDHLGSLSVVTNSAGNTVQTATYYPYGETRTNTGTVDIPYKFTGQEFDPETGLYYYKSRYYDPAIGRFITPDPLYQAAYDPSTFPRLIGFDYR